MTDADARLKALFAEDEPPPRDPVFAAAVIARVERRRFVLDIARLAGVAALGGLSLWALWPSVQPILATAGQGLAPAAGALALAITLVAVLDGRLGAAFAADS